MPMNCPPGRLRSDTIPIATGKPTGAKTTGHDTCASFAATATIVPDATQDIDPFAEDSCGITKLVARFRLEHMLDRGRTILDVTARGPAPFSKLAMIGAAGAVGVGWRDPILQIFPACCASAASGTAKSATELLRNLRRSTTRPHDPPVAAATAGWWVRGLWRS